MRTRVSTLRCPRVLRNPLRRFFLNTRSLGPRASPSTTPTTFALATNGAPATMSPASFSMSSTWSNVKAEPCSPGVPSISITAPGVTLICRPRVWTIAYTSNTSMETGDRRPRPASLRKHYRLTDLARRGQQARRGPKGHVLLEKDARALDLLDAQGAQE